MKSQPQNPEFRNNAENFLPGSSDTIILTLISNQSSGVNSSLISWLHQNLEIHCFKDRIEFSKIKMQSHSAY